MLGASLKRALRLEGPLLKNLELLVKEENEERKDERKNLKKEKPILR